MSDCRVSVLKLCLCFLATMALLWAPAGSAQSMLPSLPGVHIDLPGQTNETQNVTIGLKKSAIITFERPAADIIVSDPSVADVSAKTRRQIIFTGLSVGETNAFVFDENGNQILNLEIRVEPDLTVLRETLLRHIPDSRIQSESLNGTIILTGNVKSQAEALRAETLTETFSGGEINNLLTIDAGDQVMLQVRIIEMQRSSTKNFGVSVDGLATAGLNGGRGFGFNIGSAVTGGSFNFTDIIEKWQPTFDQNTGQWLSDELAQQLNSSIAALESIGIARVLAEPNLVVASGKEGDFLVGGEFPVITSVSAEGIPSVDFRSYGIELKFSPIVISEGRIAIEVETSITGISSEGGVTVGGFSVPGTTNKSASSSVELASGQTMMLAGLIDSETRQTVSEIPGINRIPILGKLFSSREFVNSESELVIMMTPILVEPNRPDAFISPADGFRSPDDLDRLLLGDLNRHYSPTSGGPGLSNYRAPIGFIDE